MTSTRQMFPTSGLNSDTTFGKTRWSWYISEMLSYQKKPTDEEDVAAVFKGAHAFQASHPIFWALGEGSKPIMQSVKEKKSARVPFRWVFYSCCLYRQMLAWKDEEEDALGFQWNIVHQICRRSLARYIKLVTLRINLYLCFYPDIFYSMLNLILLVLFVRDSPVISIIILDWYHAGY